LKFTQAITFILISYCLQAQGETTGTELLKSRRYLEARKHFEEMIVEHWGSADSHYGAGLACYYLKDYKDAIRYLNNAIAIDNSAAPYYYYKANAYYAMGNFSEALKFFVEAENANDKSLEKIDKLNSSFYRGLCYVKTREYYTAIDVFSDVLVMDSGYTKAYINRGISKGYTGDIKEACQDFKTAYILGDESVTKYILKYCPATTQELNISK